MKLSTHRGLIHFLIVVCFVLVSGCKTGGQNQSTVAQEEVEVIEESFQDQDAVAIEEQPPADFMTELAKQHPAINHLRLDSATKWDEIKVSNGEHEVALDPAMFEFMPHIFLIRENDMDFPSGIHGEIDPFTVKLINDEATIRFDVQSRNYGMLPDITQDMVFRLDGDLYNLGRAFLPRPEYLPQESIESRLINSGAIRCQYDGYSYYMFSEFRIRGLAKTFLAGEKKAVEEPEDVLTEEWLQENVFYLHGEEIIMRVYDNYILLIDGDDKRYWYEADPELLTQLHSVLTAG